MRFPRQKISPKAKLSSPTAILHPEKPEGMLFSRKNVFSPPRMQQAPTYRYHPAAPCIDERITPVALAGPALTRYGMRHAERAQ